MKKMAIFLLAVLVLTASGPVCGLAETADSLTGQASSEIEGSQNSPEYWINPVLFGQFSIEGRQPEMQRFKLANVTANGRETGQFQNSGQSQSNRFNMPGPGRNGNVVRNTRPASGSERNEHVNPFTQSENPSGREVMDREDLREFLEEQTLWTDGESLQQYVTPDAEAVESYLEENGLDDKYEIYEAALSWVWVSDETLHDTDEKWLTPTEFLEDTPAYDTNPASGRIAGDCEEQANALASLLIASGEYDESTVRVAVGDVNFGSGTGGHAWVEVYEAGEWISLDATGGPYYDDESSELLAVDASGEEYGYYSSGEYPALEVWYYYNNLYFTEVGEGTGDVPDFWAESPESYL